MSDHEERAEDGRRERAIGPDPTTKIDPIEGALALADNSVLVTSMNPGCVEARCGASIAKRQDALKILAAEVRGLRQDLEACEHLGQAAANGYKHELATADDLRVQLSEMTYDRDRAHQALEEERDDLRARLAEHEGPPAKENP